MPRKSFAEKLRELRRQRGLSQEDLAARAGIPEEAILQYEHGLKEPRWTRFIRLVRALEASVAEFEECLP